MANPRQIERVIRGSVFDFALVYEFHEQDEDEEEAAEIPDDIFLLAEGMKLLQCDYLGGHGSRGYGRVKFTNLEMNPVVGSLAPSVLEKCRTALAGV